MKFIKDILRGVAIGIANIIPGVSGGTMMVSMGIYGEVISAVTGMTKNFIRSIKTLLPYGIGMLSGIVGLSFVIEYLFAEFPLQTACLFIGLIFGGIPMLLPKVAGKRPSVVELLVFAAFFLLIIGMQFLGEGTQKVLSAGVETALPLLIVGTIAAAAMVIPGVSGSMILMSLGYYTPIIGKINEFVISLVSMDIKSLFDGFLILFPFGIGVITGIFFVAKLIEYLMEHHERMTYFAILGLVVSSPIAVLGGITITHIGILGVLISVVMFGIGTLVAWLLAK